MKRKMPSWVDYISDLPQSIIETILTKLPLRDTVRTSILSSKWRYKWATLKDFELDDGFVSTRTRTQEISLSKFISRFLLLHDGSINKFSLSTNYIQSSPDVDQWLLCLSRKDVKELVVDLGSDLFRAPSCLFSCQKLIRLEVCGWELSPPVSFKGFPFLKHLTLRRVLIGQDALQNLISCCSLLESFKLSHQEILEIAIRAPNLKHLTLKGAIKDIYFENTPKLVAITVSMYMTSDIEHHFRQISSCNFDKFLGGLPSLQRLTGRSYFTKYMSIGNNTFGKTEMKFLQLKVIELSELSFEDIEEIMVVLRLILNAPNLQELQIGSSSYLSSTIEPPEDLWENECLFGCTLKRLKLVKMMCMNGLPHEVEFLGFLLENSPVLEIMSITPTVCMPELKLRVLMELMRFKRASTEAELKFVQN